MWNPIVVAPMPGAPNGPMWVLFVGAKIFHDPKDFIPWELWYYSIVRINSIP